jgi:hypothetical protein
MSKIFRKMLGKREYAASFGHTVFAPRVEKVQQY